MTFPSDFERRLGFDQLRERVLKYCIGSLGTQRVMQMSFATEYEWIKTQLGQTAEFKQILEKGDEFPGTHFYDPASYFATAAIEGSFLEEEVFYQILLSLQTIAACQKYIAANATTLPELNKLAQPVSIPAVVVQSIQSKFTDSGRVHDHASAELAHVRKRLREEESRVKRLVDQHFRKAVEQGWVPEGAIVTIRDGRPAIPVLAEHKRKMAGYILDESATGQTVYMEPAEVLNANNEIRDLQHADRREVVRILKELTTHLRYHLPALTLAYNFLGEIDFVRAKAKVAIDLQAELPQLKPYPYLNWLEARHPLLYLSLKGKRELVPLTIDLPDEKSFLLVSGPNAGGKSVCLKTVGLIQYMVQCGMLAPLHDKSTVGIFRKILLDIGDQQSLENDLSTYSSHLQNMAFFLQQANAQSLVLLDELGAGTDPNFGGGIAEAVLDGLLAKGAWGVATTHYYNLKLFADQHPRIRNAAMLFDTQQLGPLFKLEIGKPGSSFALEIARKTGLPAAVLAKAEEIIGKELTGLETLMKTVADEKAQLDKRVREFALREKQLQETMQRYEALSTELTGRKKEIIEKAKTEAANLLKETNREIEKTIRHIKENKAEKKETKKVREGLKELVQKVAVQKQVVTSADKIEVGASVRLIGQEVSGKVISIKDEVAVVQFGDLRSSVKLKQLVRSEQALQNPTSIKARSLGVDVMNKQARFITTLDIRGKRVEEVGALVDQFLDDALLLGQAEIKILHGKGEGVLRKVVRDRLKATKGVASFADEHVDRGGDGITVVVLK
ncbi:MAG: Smr/MutS family protein [Cytophagales bacterium]|nr:Smr/MutS family protein [Cytophagales bacterium]